MMFSVAQPHGFDELLRYETLIQILKAFDNSSTHHK